MPAEGLHGVGQVVGRRCEKPAAEETGGVDTEEGQGVGGEEVGNQVRDGRIGHQADLQGRGEGDRPRAGMQGRGHADVDLIRQCLDFQVPTEGLNEGLVEGARINMSEELSPFHFPAPGKQDAQKAPVHGLGVEGFRHSPRQQHHFDPFLRQALSDTRRLCVHVHFHQGVTVAGQVQ